MQTERWKQIEEIFQSAIDCPAEKRPALLDSACGDDAELRRELESLLEINEKNGWTDSSAVDDAIKVLEQRSAELSEGRRIGAYCILREIGRGGMGTVFLAARADDEFQKLVAIKIIRRGLDTDDIVQRFRAERQILAMFDHPNVARLLDGGSTDDGLPYFVMEYIQGEPIDVYCDARRLNITGRLRLFQGVCAAVSYAHQNLVIHRDIKPGNILVTKEGVPRLLDFGIAKLLSAGAQSDERTRTHARPLTPDYASPEQILGEPITTASDVYSLGILLYILLTGLPPHRRVTSSPAVLERAICEEEPQRPSAAVLRDDAERRGTGAGSAARSEMREGSPDKLRRRLEGDLDNIVLLALRKEPTRRYSSAEHLSEDISRHLANLPVRARPDTRGYRAAKFIRRNKTWVAMAAVTFLSLAAGIAESLWQTHVVRQQRDLARLEQAKATQINAFLQEMVGFSGVAGGTATHRYNATVAEMLDDAAGRVDKELADQPAVRAELLTTIGTTYMTQARIEPAQRYLHEAYDLSLKVYGPSGYRTGAIMAALADLAYRKGDYEAAEGWMDKALPIFRNEAKNPNFEIRFLVAALSDAAFIKRALGRFEQAEALWREALMFGPRIPARYRGMSISPKTFLAQLYMDRGDVERADPLALEASQQLRALGEDRFLLAQSLLDLGNVRCFEGRYAEAEPLIQAGIRIYTETQGADHPNVAYGLRILSTLHYYQGRYALAEQDAQRILEIVQNLPKGTSYYGTAYIALGRAMTKRGRAREAEPLLREALAIGQKSSRRGDIAEIRGYLAECLIAQKRYAEAEPLLIESYQTLKSSQVPASPALKEARERLASFYAAWGKPSPSTQ